jgi:hypothetical protein
MRRSTLAPPDKCSDGAQLSGHGGPTGTGAPAVRLKRLGSDDRRGSEGRGVSFETDDRARSMLWSQTQDRRFEDPERQLLDAITAGELDDHLVAIDDAVHARRQLLHTVRSARAIAELPVGDRVTFTNRIRPRYLEHELAEVTEVDDRTVTARLSRPVGRFGDRGPGARRSRCSSSNAEPRPDTVERLAVRPRAPIPRRP